MMGAALSAKSRPMSLDRRLSEPSNSVSSAREREDDAAIVGEHEGDVGARHREALDDVDDGERFRARRFQEFEPRGRGEEEVPHLDARAALPAGEEARGLRTIADRRLRP